MIKTRFDLDRWFAAARVTAWVCECLPLQTMFEHGVLVS
jgi:hypothetical protein